MFNCNSKMISILRTLLILYLFASFVENNDESKEKDVCCMLGRIAGDKGYHCHAMFYNLDILDRNTNRAHNKKLSFYGRDKMPHFGEKLMIRFEKCLAKRMTSFNKCCYLTAKQKQNQMNPQFDTIKRYLRNKSKN